MLQSYRFNFLSLFGLCIVMSFPNLLQASDKKSCNEYLKTDTESSQSLFDSTLQSLILTQERMANIQAEHIEQIRRHMKERSLPLKTKGLYPVPVLDPNTLKLMSQWPTSSQPGPARDQLEAKILRDPYLVWLQNNWEDLRPREILKAKADYSMIPRVDGGFGPLPQGVANNITEYLDFHLSFIGPMSLNPELLVLRLMLDHDPEIIKSDRILIFQVLGIQKILYVLNSELRRLAYYEFGSDEQWDAFSSYRNAMAEFHSLKEKVRFMSSGYSYGQFSKLQLAGELPEDITFEDYLVTQVLAKSGDPFDYQIYEKYMLLKNIIHYVSMAQDEAALKEHVEYRVEFLFPYFLF